MFRIVGQQLRMYIYTHTHIYDMYFRVLEAQQTSRSISTDNGAAGESGRAGEGEGEGSHVTGAPKTHLCK